MYWGKLIVFGKIATTSVEKVACKRKLLIQLFVAKSAWDFLQKHIISSVETNPGHFGPGLFRPRLFRPIFRVGRFGLGRCVVSAHYRGESFRPWVVSAKNYRNY